MRQRLCEALDQRPNVLRGVPCDDPGNAAHSVIHSYDSGLGSPRGPPPTILPVMFKKNLDPPMPFDVVHIAYTTFPADSRVKREARASVGVGGPVAVLALAGPGQPDEEDIGDLHVIRIPGRKTRGGPLAYLAEYASFTWRSRRLLQRDSRLRGVRIVHIHTLPDFLIWAAIPARRRGARLVLDLHEIFPEFTSSRYPGALGALLTNVARYVERWARRRADLTITVNGPIEELLKRRAIGRQEQTLILHNSPDPDDFGEPLPPRETQTSGPLELIYHGTLTRMYGLDVAIRGIAEARRLGVDAHLTILGDGPERLRLVSLVRAMALDEVVRFEGVLPQRDLPARLTRCTAGLVPTRLDGMTRYSLSNKLLEYIHLGLPVLAARLPAYTQYLPDDAAWYWTAGDATDLARVIESYGLASPTERAHRAQRAQAAVASIAWQGEREKLRRAYRNLLSIHHG